MKEGTQEWLFFAPSPTGIAAYNAEGDTGLIVYSGNSEDSQSQI